MAETSLKRMAGIAWQLPGVLRQAMAIHHGSLLGVSKRLYATMKQRYTPDEALVEGLLNPSLPDEELDRRCSQSTISRIQRKRSPATWRPLISDKGVFYRYCEAAGIPVPPLFAIFSRTTPGWTCKGRLLVRREEWVSYFTKECPPEFVIKPSTGRRGGGIRFLRRTGTEFQTPDGQTFSAAGLYDGMVENTSTETFIIQARLRNHPALEELHGTKALHTIRIATALTPDAKCIVLFAIYKIIGGNAYVDNICHGRTGNIPVEVDLEKGIILEDRRDGRNSPMVHPKSGLPLTGFRVPFWQEAVDLARKAALKFSPIGMVGWDVAVTPNGPVIIEGNLWFEIFSASDARPILAALAATDARPD